MTHKEEVEHLNTRSREFLETSEYQIRRGFYALSVFNAEQALQLFLKAKLLEEGVEYPRTHGVRSLLELLSSIADEETSSHIHLIMEENLIELGALEDAYITSRYVMREYRREEAEKLLKIVEGVIEVVQ